MRFISVVAGIFLFACAPAAWGCAVSATAVNFGGGYDSYTQLDATGSIIVTCANGLTYTVRIDAGANSGGGFIPRKARLAGGVNEASYNLYIDPARTQVWGDGTQNTFVRTGGGIGTAEILTVYGRLPSGQNLASGYYSDALIVTVEW